MKSIQEYFKQNLAYGFEHYKDFIFGLIVGLFLGWVYHKFIGNRTLKNSYRTLLDSKDETINAYKEIIGGRLAQSDVEKKDKDFFNRLKKFFRSGTPK